MCEGLKRLAHFRSERRRGYLKIRTGSENWDWDNVNHIHQEDIRLRFPEQHLTPNCWWFKENSPRLSQFRYFKHKSPSLKTCNTFHNCQMLVEMDCLLHFNKMYVLTWFQWLTWYDLALLEGLHEAVHLLLRQEQIQIILQQKGETMAETYTW